MLIETQRLIIRDLQTEDGISFAEMAADGSLNDCGLDKDCHRWMTEWVAEAKKLAIRDNPKMDWLAYTVSLKNEDLVVGSIGCSYYDDLEEIGITYFIGAQYRNNGYASEAIRAYVKYFFNNYDGQKMIATVRDENVSSCKAVEKAGFRLTEKRMYKDLNDDKEEIYHFYEIIREKLISGLLDRESNRIIKFS